LPKAGRSIPANIAMIAITTNNSMRVKPRRQALTARGELGMIILEPSQSVQKKSTLISSGQKNSPYLGQ
jgi:hypothetical protein